MTLAWRNRVTAKCNQLAKLIREKGPISFANLCLEAHIAPSTLYSYLPLLLELFGDIEYEDRTFKKRGNK